MFGRTVWERNLHQAGYAAGLAVTGEHIVIHERWTRMVGLDPRDGTQRWDVPVGTWPRGIVIAGEHCLVIPQSVPRLLCLDVRTGELLWSALLAEFTGHLVATRDTVMVGGWRGYTPLTAFDLRTGTLLWRSAKSAELVVPAVVGTGVLVGEPHGSEIRLIDPRDGRTRSRWSLPEPLASGDARPVLTPLDGDRVLARSGPRRVVEISLSTGAVADFYRSDEDLASQAVGWTGSTLWVPNARGGTLAIDTHCARPMRAFGAVQPFVGHPVQVDSGFVIAARHGLLGLVDPDLEAPCYSKFIGRRINALCDHGPSTVLILAKGTLRVVEVDTTAGP
ncbi:PQQ-binding-like beta-propeller repeat protein [Streptomyces sp. NPDC054783]